MNTKLKDINNISLEFAEVLFALTNSFRNISFYFIIINISSYCPTMNHVGKFMRSCFLCTKSLFQNINNLTIWFYICWIVSCRKHIGRAFNFLSQIINISSKNLLKTNWWMHSCNANNIWILSCHSKGKPNSPTKTNTVKGFMSFLL